MLEILESTAKSFPEAHTRGVNDKGKKQRVGVAMKTAINKVKTIIDQNQAAVKNRELVRNTVATELR